MMTTNITESPNTMLTGENEFSVASIFNFIAKKFAVKF